MAIEASKFDAPLLHETYRLLEPLAVGGMGEVYLASHERLPGLFAVKIPHRHLRQDADALSRFHAEAQILASLDHPNIVRVIDFNVSACGTPYLVMEMIKGDHLRYHLSEDGPFKAERVGHVVGQIANALQLAHDHGIVHCDLKLENVMLTSSRYQKDVVKLLDFGIAQTGCASESSSESVCRGTPQFMAPEQVQGDDIDDRTDQFALACIAYSLLVGREPFQGENRIAVLYQVVHQEPDSLETCLGPSYRPASEVLRRAMAKDPDLRFASILEFAGALERALACVAVDATRLVCAA